MKFERSGDELRKSLRRARLDARYYTVLAVAALVAMGASLYLLSSQTVLVVEKFGLLLGLLLCIEATIAIAAGMIAIHARNRARRIDHNLTENYLQIRDIRTMKIYS